jgi:drug/metabolite transporter (DMT)-like permease
VAILSRRGRDWVPPRDAWPSLALMGFVGIAFHQLLQGYALTLTGAVHTGWLIGLTPIWSALLAALVLHERFGPRKVAGLLLGFAGAVVVVTRGHFSADLAALPSTRGDLLILLSTVNWAVYSVPDIRPCAGWARRARRWAPWRRDGCSAGSRWRGRAPGATTRA